MIKNDAENNLSAPVFVVSGGLGALGEQLVHTTLAQFQDMNIPEKTFSRIHYREQVEAIIEEAVVTGATIVHTLSDSKIRHILLQRAKEENITTFDIVGPFLEHMTDTLGQTPLGKPGLYRLVRSAYFKRMEAVDFTLTHDDGMNYEGWSEAEIVLVGVSRVGKTPLSLYLAIMGWKVANIPLVMSVPPRKELFELDRRRVIGLTIDPHQLLSHRQHRQRNLGVKGDSTYAELPNLYEEIKAARQVMRKARFKVIDSTDKPIETTADQVLTAVMRNLKKLKPRDKS